LTFFVLDKGGYGIARFLVARREDAFLLLEDDVSCFLLEEPDDDVGGAFRFPPVFLDSP
jgi:hypothetical protein